VNVSNPKEILDFAAECESTRLREVNQALCVKKATGEGIADSEIVREWHAFLPEFTGTPNTSESLLNAFRDYFEALEKQAGSAFSPPSVEEHEDTLGIYAYWNRDDWFAEVTFELDGTYTVFWGVYALGEKGGEREWIPEAFTNFVVSRMIQDPRN